MEIATCLDVHIYRWMWVLQQVLQESQGTYYWCSSGNGQR